MSLPAKLVRAYKPALSQRKAHDIDVVDNLR